MSKAEHNANRFSDFAFATTYGIFMMVKLRRITERGSSMDGFAFDQRLGIRLPRFADSWSEMSRDEQADIIATWETIRSEIPDRVIWFEQQLDQLQERVREEDDWDEVCRLYQQLGALASCLSDLNMWYRTQPELLGEGASGQRTGKY